MEIKTCMWCGFGAEEKHLDNTVTVTGCRKTEKNSVI